MGLVNPSAGVYVNEIDQSQVVVGASSSIGAIVGESLRGPVGTTQLITSTKQFLSMFGPPNPQVSFMHYAALAFLQNASQLYVTRVAITPATGGDQTALTGGCTVYLNNNLNAIEPWTTGAVDPTIEPFQLTDLFQIYGVNPGAWNGTLSVRIYPNTNAADNTFYVDVYVMGQGQPVERFLVSLNYQLDGYGVQQNIQENINPRSSYIQVSQNYDNASFKANPTQTFVNTLVTQTLFGGADATNRASSGDIMNAWDLYQDPEQISINLLINGGYSTPEVQLHMVDLCTNRMDCMAILDTPSLSQRVSDAIQYRRNTLNKSSSYAALYTPDYLILDQYNDIQLYVPPSGHIAAAYALTDTKYNLWFAPAGMNRGVLDVLGVRETYNQGDRDALYENQINATRVILGSGIRIWGADTLQTMASALSNVSVRRLMMYLEKSLSTAALYSVFDPNDYILRAQLVELCERFMNPIKNARGMYGFGVVCDDTNNSPASVALGNLILDVYVDPVLPAKRIYLTAIVTKTGASFTNS